MTPQQQYAQMIANGVDPATAQQIAYGSGSTSADPSTGPVYWESAPPVISTNPASAGIYTPNGVAAGTRVPAQQTLVTKSQNDAMYWLEQQAYQDTPAYQAILAQMIAAGQVKPGAVMGDVLSVWSKYLGLSAISTAQGGTLSPQDYLEHDARLNQAANPNGTTTTSSTRSTDKISAADAEAEAQNVAQTAIGRRLKPGEAAAYVGGARALQAANPSVSTTTSHTNAAGTAQTNTTSTSGGADQAAIDEEMLHQAMANPEYGAYQAAGYYFPMLENEVGSITSAGL